MTRPIEELIRTLPPEGQQQVRDFIERLLSKQRSRPRGRPKLAWAGALKDLRDRYTFVELQHEISRWRIGGQ